MQSMPVNPVDEFTAECENLMGRAVINLALLRSNAENRIALNNLQSNVHAMKNLGYLFGFRKLSRLLEILERTLEGVSESFDELPASEKAILNSGLEVSLQLVRHIKSAGGEDSFEIVWENFTEVGNVLKLVPPEKSGLLIEVGGAPFSGTELSTFEIETLSGPPATSVQMSKAQKSLVSPTSDASHRPVSVKMKFSPGFIEKIETQVTSLEYIANGLFALLSDLPENALHIRDKIIRAEADMRIVISKVTSEIYSSQFRPLSSITTKFVRLIRDMSKDLQKKIEIDVDENETVIEISLVECVRDVLTHLVRNAADHGIELPSDRVTAGKPEFGKISISSERKDGFITISVSDDGCGLNDDKILKKALSLGLLPELKAQTLSQSEIFQMVFEPGFSTATQVSTISGRGIGMDVVKSSVDGAGGTVSLMSKQGHGTTVTVKLPVK